MDAGDAAGFQPVSVYADVRVWEMVDWAQLYLFELIFMRMSGFLLFNPLLGRSNLPAMVKTGMALVLSILVFGTAGTGVPQPDTLVELAFRLLLELGIGLVLGFVMRVVFSVVQIGGEVIDTQMGVTMAQIYDASSQANLSVTASLLNILLILDFFAENGHYTDALADHLRCFPPVVDDPYDFGQIAAANALSDVYAMGGEPRLAMNLLAVPSCLPREAVGAILEGGAAKVAEAGAVTAGGHSIEDTEPKYGLCVSGLVHPGAVLTNRGAREGDLLVLTKPLGTGILTTAAKAELLSGAEYRAMTDLMAALNRDAARAAVPLRPSACTDVTGFGLIGHAREMAEGAGCTIELWPGRVPIVPQALELARDGIIPAGAYRNLEFAGPEVETAGTFPQAVLDCLYDPQTSGGLLLAIAEERGAELLRRLADTGVTAAAVGRVRPRGPRRIVLKP